MTIYVTIGNSDNKLTQVEWADFWDAVDSSIRYHAHQIHGAFLSLPNSMYQNACWSFESLPGTEGIEGRLALWNELRDHAKEYRQDAIAWVEGDGLMIDGGPRE